jgi:hypothetical protein
MKLKIIIAFFLLNITIQLIQGQTASELFIKLPESTIFPLAVSDRLNLINQYKDGEKATITNGFGDTCSALRLKDDYIQIRIGNNTMELFLLPLINDSKIIGLIQTVCAPACDSQLEFYTTSWKALTASTFITFAGKNAFIKEEIHPEEEKIKNALILLDLSLMQLKYDPDKKELQQYYTTPDYLNEEDKTRAKPYLKEMPKRFKWNLTRFE